GFHCSSCLLDATHSCSTVPAAAFPVRPGAGYAQKKPRHGGGVEGWRVVCSVTEEHPCVQRVAAHVVAPAGRSPGRELLGEVVEEAGAEADIVAAVAHVDVADAAIDLERRRQH